MYHYDFMDRYGYVLTLMYSPMCKPCIFLWNRCACQSVNRTKTQRRARLGERTRILPGAKLCDVCTKNAARFTVAANFRFLYIRAKDSRRLCNTPQELALQGV